jgi:hypothetical protein
MRRYALMAEGTCEPQVSRSNLSEEYYRMEHVYVPRGMTLV